MATKALISMNGKDITANFSAKGALVLQAQSPATTAWQNAIESLGMIQPAFVELFKNESLKDEVLTVETDATTTAPAMKIEWKFGTIAAFISKAQEVAALFENFSASPSVVVTGEKLEAGEAKKGVTRKTQSAESLLASIKA